MPHCWKIYKKNDINKTAIDPIEVDEEICRQIGISPDPVEYYEDWWDIVGCGLICGQSIPQLIEEVRLSSYYNEKIETMLQVLSEYSGEAWYRSSGFR
jgi:hypothetical protein